MAFWMNGRFRSDERAVDIRDRGWLLGDGVFETIRVQDSTPLFLSRHLRRLRLSLDALSLQAECPGNLPDLISELAVRNGLSQESAVARLTMTRGSSNRGLTFPDSATSQPTSLLTVQKYRPPDGELRLQISRYQRAETSLCARHKTLNYLDNLMAQNEARQQGCHEALLFNSRNRLACATSANVILIRPDGTLLTPSIVEGALPGIVRGILLEKAQIHGSKIQETRIDKTKLDGATIVLTNSLMGVRQGYLDPGLQAPSAQASQAFRRLRSWYRQTRAEDVKLRSD